MLPLHIEPLQSSWAQQGKVKTPNSTEIGKGGINTSWPVLVWGFNQYKHSPHPDTCMASEVSGEAPEEHSHTPAVCSPSTRKLRGGQPRGVTSSSPPTLVPLTPLPPPATPPRAQHSSPCFPTGSLGSLSWSWRQAGKHTV